MTSVMDDLRKLLYSFPQVRLKGAENMANKEKLTVFDSRAEQFAQAIVDEGKPQHSVFHTSLEEKYMNMCESYKGGSLKDLKYSLLVTLKGEQGDHRFENSIEQFKRMNVSDEIIEGLENDYREYFDVPKLASKSFSEVAKPILAPLTNFRALKIGRYYNELKKTMSEGEREAFKAAWDLFEEGVEKYWEDGKRGDAELSEDSFLNYLEREMADDGVEGSLAHWKKVIYDYVKGQEGEVEVNGEKTTVKILENANKNLVAEWNKVVKAKQGVEDESLADRIVDDFLEADRECLDLLWRESQNLGNLLPKNSPRKFVDCVSTVLSQHAVSALKRVGKDLIRLHQRV